MSECTERKDDHFTDVRKMTADEMFDSIGYSICEEPDFIEYFDFDKRTAIEFDKKSKTIRVWDESDYNYPAESFGMKELEAMHAKAKEMGWIE